MELDLIQVHWSILLIDNVFEVSLSGLSGLQKRSMLCAFRLCVALPSGVFDPRRSHVFTEGVSQFGRAVPLG